MAGGWGGDSMQGYVERQIRAAQERGDFDDLEGTGRPIADLDRPHDENWWIRRKLREEQFVAVPPALRLRRDVEEARARIVAAATEAEVMAEVAAINERIRLANATIVSGPPSTVWPLDIDRVLARWRATHPAVSERAPAPDPAPDPGPTDQSRPAQPARRWWHRLRRR